MQGTHTGGQRFKTIVVRLGDEGDLFERQSSPFHEYIERIGAMTFTQAARRLSTKSPAMRSASSAEAAVM